MTLNQDQIIANNRIKNIISEIRRYDRKDKSKILETAIADRLNKSLKQYYSELDEAFNRLINYNDKHNMSVMKKLNKD